jgi:hypothetical protein
LYERRDRSQGSKDGPLDDLGRSERTGGDNIREGRSGRSGRSEDGFAGVVRCRGLCDLEVVLERGRDSGADEILRLCRRSSSACSVFTGDEGRPDFLLGLVA